MIDIEIIEKRLYEIQDKFYTQDDGMWLMDEAEWFIHTLRCSLTDLKFQKDRADAAEDFIKLQGWEIEYKK